MYKQVTDIVTKPNLIHILSMRNKAKDIELTTIV
jgi:hypothetical protein